ncbi:teichoic acid/polysaccharide export protein [Listeria cornellensis FSL F6-0969]|uniref:Teichoic acid/polysaccharide export protein n=1 Tax=Listeria cornellensis FSL F6-0969 TaxID=1265820 RepID=W7C3I4_9LIST|nr:lipid II flippase MurJ [Listeria cornellensis]EUJ30221.1 teichoic acid/polysaccharide export protein [Listeria cornellensis FSL F6-0969]
MEGDFTTSKIAILVMAIMNVSYLFLVRSPTISGVAIVLSSAYFIEFFILKMKNKSYHWFMRWEWRNPAFQKLARQSVPLMFTEGVFQFSILLTSSIMGWLNTAYLPAMNYVNILVTIVQSLLLLNILTVLFPKLSRMFAMDIEAAKEALICYINRTNTVVIWIVAMFIAIGDQIIAMLFQHGAFTGENTQMVYMFLIITALALPGLVVRDFLYRSFYSQGNTKIPSFISIIAIVGVMVMLLIFLPLHNVYFILGVPVIATYGSSIWAYRRLQGSIGKIDPSYKLLKQHGIVVFHAIVIGCILYEIKSKLVFNVYANVLILLLLGLAMYVLGLLVTTKKRRRDHG